MIFTNNKSEEEYIKEMSPEEYLLYSRIKFCDNEEKKEYIFTEKQVPVTNEFQIKQTYYEMEEVKNNENNEFLNNTKNEEKEKIETKKRWYHCLPIFTRQPLDESLVEKRHQKRREDCMTEIFGQLAELENMDVNTILRNYSVCLLEKEDGSKSIGCEFPQKRFY